MNWVMDVKCLRAFNQRKMKVMDIIERTKGQTEDSTESKKTGIILIHSNKLEVKGSTFMKNFYVQNDCINTRNYNFQKKHRLPLGSE